MQNKKSLQIWTLAIVISQELPEVLFDVIFVGPLGKSLMKNLRFRDNF